MKFPSRKFNSRAAHLLSASRIECVPSPLPCAARERQKTHRKPRASGVLGTLASHSALHGQVQSEFFVPGLAAAGKQKPAQRKQQNERDDPFPSASFHALRLLSKKTSSREKARACKNISALAELRSATSGLQAVLLKATGLRPLDFLDFLRGPGFLTPKLTHFFRRLNHRQPYY